MGIRDRQNKIQMVEAFKGYIYLFGLNMISTRYVGLSNLKHVTIIKNVGVTTGKPKRPGSYLGNEESIMAVSTLKFGVSHDIVPVHLSHDKSLYHIISYYIILYHIISYCFILYHIIYCIILYHIVSYYIISYCIILFHIISYYIILFHIVSYYIISYCIILFHIISYYIILFHIVSYYIISYCIILYHIISYYIISFYIISYYIILVHIISYYFISYHHKQHSAMIFRVRTTLRNHDWLHYGWACSSATWVTFHHRASILQLVEVISIVVAIPFVAKPTVCCPEHHPFS